VPNERLGGVGRWRHDLHVALAQAPVDGERGGPLARLRHALRMRDPEALDGRSEALVDAIVRGVERTIVPWHRAEVRGIERVPQGAGLFVGSHNSFAYMPETYLLGSALYRQFGIEGVPYGLAHDWLGSLPLINPLLVSMGGVSASHEAGERLIRAGKKVLVFPGGDLDAMRPFRRRNAITFDGRRGYIRLALRSGAPIVPFVAWGAHSTVIVVDDMRWLARRLGLTKLRIKAFPITLSIPWGLTLGPPPPFVPFPSKIVVEICEPIRLDPTGRRFADDGAYVAACARRVEDAMQRTLERLAGERR
jgi:1-acyl-sn-glycerol-3-phosphate acyltransferase